MVNKTSVILSEQVSIQLILNLHSANISIYENRFKNYPAFMRLSNADFNC